MHNHQPNGYLCPFCRIIAGAKDSLESTEVIHQDEAVTAFLSIVRWERNPLDILVVPNQHFENLYDLPLKLAPALHRVTRAMALALKGYTRCEGVSHARRFQTAIA